MLHKMYLLPAEFYHPSPHPPAKKGRKYSLRRRQHPTKPHPHTEWTKLRTKHHEAELQRNARTKEIADFMKQIMPAAPIPQPPTADIQLPTPKANSRRGTQTDVTTSSVAATNIRPSKEIVYETPKREPVRVDDAADGDDYDDEFLEEDAKWFGRENIGPVPSPLPNALCLRESFSTHNTLYVRKVICLRLAIPRC